MEEKVEYKVKTLPELAVESTKVTTNNVKCFISKTQDSTYEKTVKTISALSAISLKNKLDAECKVSYLLRQLAISLGGGSAIKLHLVFTYLQDRGWSKATISEVLKNGNNIFWTRNTSKKQDKTEYVVLESWANLLKYFDIPYSESYYNYRVPENKLIPGRVGRAYLYASATAKYNARQKYRVAIEQETGCGPYLQRIYEEIAGITIEENFPDGGSDGDNLNKQLPNTYYNPLQKCRIRSLKDAAGKFVTSLKSIVIEHFYSRHFKSEAVLEKYITKNPECRNLKRTIFVRMVDKLDYFFEQQGFIQITHKRKWQQMCLIPA